MNTKILFNILVFLLLLMILAFQAVKADQTTCVTIGNQIHCTTTPSVGVPTQGFDASVIGSIGDRPFLSDEAIRQLMIRRCLKLAQQANLTPEEAIARCLR